VPCAADPECASGFCDPADGTCACDEDADCPSGECDQSVDPNDPRPYYYLGFIYREANQKQAAILAFKKYLKLDPQSKEREDIEDQIYSLTH